MRYWLPHIHPCAKLVTANFRVVLEELLWCVVIATGRFVVATTYRLMYRVSVIIDIEGEATLGTASGAGVPRCDAGVFLQMIFVLHSLFGFVVPQSGLRFTWFIWFT